MVSGGRIRDVARLALAGACLTAATALGAGCSTSTDGKPVAVPTGPTEPTVSTPRPTRTTVTTTQPTTVTTTPPTTAAPPAGETLPADAQGYVFVETKSGLTRCQLSSSSVGCEAQFTNPPIQDGSPANGVSVTPGGDLKWIVGNLGNIPTVPLDYRVYHAVGWTIDATEGGTRFTNDSTGHGMFVSIEAVDAF